MMEITIVSPLYPPETIVSAYTSEMLASALTEKGHQVHVLTAFPNQPNGEIYPGFKRKLIETQEKSEFLIISRCFSFLSPHSTMISRFVENISFGLVSGLVLLFTKKPDVIYANTWPLFAQSIVALICKIRNVPLVLSIQDIYPESLVAQNRLRDGSLSVKLLRSFDKKISANAKALVVISEGFANIYQESRGVPPEKIHIIPNFLRDFHDPDKSTRSYRSDLNISKDKVVFIYGGNIGQGAGLEDVIEAFKALKDSCELVVAGSGSQLDKCINQARGYEHIHIISPWPEQETQPLLAAGDVALLSTAGQQSLVSVPSKLITYMLAAKPILAITMTQSDIAKIIHETHCGWIVIPGNKELLTTKLISIIKTPKTTLDEMGQSGRSFALLHYTDKACLPHLVEIIESNLNE